MPLINEKMLREEQQIGKKSFINQFNTSMFSGKYQKVLEQFKERSRAGELALRLEILKNCKEFGKVALAIKTFSEKGSFPNEIKGKPRKDYERLNKILEIDDLQMFLIELFGNSSDVWNEGLIPELHEAGLFYYLTDENIFFDKFVPSLDVSKFDYLKTLEMSLYNSIFIGNQVIDEILVSFGMNCLSHELVEKMTDIELVETFNNLKESFQKFSYLFTQYDVNKRFRDDKKYFIPMKGTQKCELPDDLNHLKAIIGSAIQHYPTVVIQLEKIKTPFDLEELCLR